jgi:hypothetical protein
MLFADSVVVGLGRPHPGQAAAVVSTSLLHP